MRELEEKRVVVLPVLLENCKVPLFLKEKLYADFREDFDHGLTTILEAVAKVTNEWRGRLDNPHWHTDFAIDWGMVGKQQYFRLTMVEQNNKQEYCVLVTANIIPSVETMKWYDERVKAKTDHLARREIIYALAAHAEGREETVFRLEDQFEQTIATFLEFDGLKFKIQISARWLGTDTGRDVIFDFGSQIAGIAQCMREITKQEGVPAAEADMTEKATPKSKPARKKKRPD